MINTLSIKETFPQDFLVRVRRNISSNFSDNSEAIASELPDKLEESTCLFVSRKSTNDIA